MSSVVLDTVPLAQGQVCTAELQEGRHVLQGEGAPLRELSRRLRGELGPGRILIRGEEVARSPALRRRVVHWGSELPPRTTGTVVDWLADVQALRGVSGSVRSWLERWEQPSLAERLVPSLSVDEWRRVVMVAQLMTESPVLVALSGASADCGGLDSARVEAQVQRWAEAAPVLLLTTEAPRAGWATASQWRLDARGLLRVSAWAQNASAAGEDSVLWIEAEDPRRLLAALVLLDGVQAVGWDRQRAATWCWARGDVRRIGAELLRLAAEQGMRLSSFGVGPRPPEVFSSAYRGWAQGAFERSRYEAWHWQVSGGAR